MGGARRTFRVVGTTWLLVNVAMLLLLVYALYNNGATYYYQFEESPDRTLTPEEQVRADWHRSDERLIQIGLVFVGANLLWTVYALLATSTGPPAPRRREPP